MHGRNSNQEALKRDSPGQVITEMRINLLIAASVLCTDVFVFWPALLNQSQRSAARNALELDPPVQARLLNKSEVSLLS